MQPLGLSCWALCPLYRKAPLVMRHAWLWIEHSLNTDAKHTIIVHNVNIKVCLNYIITFNCEMHFALCCQCNTTMHHIVNFVHSWYQSQQRCLLSICCTHAHGGMCCMLQYIHCSSIISLTCITTCNDVNWFIVLWVMSLLPYSLYL